MEQKFTHEFLKEQLERQNRLNISICTKFTPNARVVPITRKFYSKFEQNELDDNEKTHKNRKLFEDYFENIPRDKYSKPMVESHLIGWIPGPFVKYDNNDLKLFHKPRRNGEITTMGELLEISKLPKRPNFKGLQFQLVV